MIDLNDGWLIYGIIPVINNFVYRQEKFRNLRKTERGIGEGGGGEERMRSSKIIYVILWVLGWLGD